MLKPMVEEIIPQKYKKRMLKNKPRNYLKLSGG